MLWIIKLKKRCLLVKKLVHPAELITSFRNNRSRKETVHFLFKAEKIGIRIAYNP